MEAEDFPWWVGWCRINCALIDILHLDHFGGLRGHWEVPASDEIAINGSWVKAPVCTFSTPSQFASPAEKAALLAARD